MRLLAAGRLGEVARSLNPAAELRQRPHIFPLRRCATVKTNFEEPFIKNRDRIVVGLQYINRPDVGFSKVPRFMTPLLQKVGIGR